jgi:DNA-binding MarR family transcriptional regulator
MAIQRQPLPKAGPTRAELADRLHSVAIRVLRRARRQDELMGLPPGQASALSVLVFGGPHTLSALARIEQVQPPTMSRMIDALERAGYVLRKHTDDDRRKVSIEPTAAGARVMQQGRARRVAELAKMLARLDMDQRAALEAALTLLEHLHETT